MSKVLNVASVGHVATNGGAAVRAGSGYPPLHVVGHPRASIILLDDDPTFGQVLQRYAKKMGAIVACYLTVKEFAEHLSEHQGGVAIIDYHLDHYTGVEVAAALGDMPVVLISGKSQWQKEEVALPAGVRRFVHKKFGAKTILEVALDLSS